MKLLDNLISSLDNSSIVKEIKEENTKLKQDKELMKLLEEYKLNPSDKLKEKVMNNKLFQEYKEKETNLNLLILDTNQRLKELNNRGGCNL